MFMEVFNPEKAKPKIYLPEVREIIDSSEPKDYLKKKEKELASMSEKKKHCAIRSAWPIWGFCWRRN